MLQRFGCTGRLVSACALSVEELRHAAATGPAPCSTRAAPTCSARSCRSHSRRRRRTLRQAYAAPHEPLGDAATEELRAALCNALRAQSRLPRDEEQLFLDAAFDVCCNDAGEERCDCAAFPSPDDVVRGLLRWQTLTGLEAAVIKDHALEAQPDFLATPAETIVRFVFLLRELLPNADLTRVLAALPLGALLRGEEGEQGSDARVTSLSYCARGALSELRQIMPEPIVQLLAEQSPMLLFGELGIADVMRLRDAWLASGSAQLSAAELAKAMRDERFVRYFVNFIM